MNSFQISRRVVRRVIHYVTHREPNERDNVQLRIFQNRFDRHVAESRRLFRRRSRLFDPILFVFAHSRRDFAAIQTAELVFRPFAFWNRIDHQKPQKTDDEHEQPGKIERQLPVEILNDQAGSDGAKAVAERDAD